MIWSCEATSPPCGVRLIEKILRLGRVLFERLEAGLLARRHLRRADDLLVPGLVRVWRCCATVVPGGGTSPGKSFWYSPSMRCIV